jgi:hypothetical protein
MLRRLVIAGSERIRFNVRSLDVEGEMQGVDPPGVCFVLGTPAVEVRDDGVVLGNGASLPASLVLRAAGDCVARATDAPASLAAHMRV